MDEKEMSLLAATILIGIITGERAGTDEKTLKRAVDLAYRLKTIVAERNIAESKPKPA